MAHDPIALQDRFEAASRAVWDAAVAATTRGRSPAELSKSSAGLDVQVLYEAPETPDPAAVGDFPFRRGTRAGTRWEAWAAYDAGSWQDIAPQLTEDIRRGASALWVPHAELFHHEDTRGLQLAPQEWDQALDILRATQTDLALELGFAPLTLLGDIRDDDWSQLLAIFDPFTGLARRGWAPAAQELWPQLAESLQRGALNLSGLAAHEAGAPPALELAVIAAGLIEALRELSPRGYTPAALAPKLRLQIGVGREMLVGMAKPRAARELVARILHHHGLAPELCSPPHHAVTTWTSLSRLDPWSNLLRATNEAYAAIVGGADILSILPFDRLLGLPDPLARRLAANLHVLLAEESLLDKVGDPCGGSGAIEALTDALCEQAWSQVQEIEAAGGLLAALEAGLIQRLAAEARDARLSASRKRKLTLVGVNDFALPEEPTLTRSPLPLPERRLEPGPDALTAAPLRPFRDAEPWEDLRGRPEHPSVWLARLGPLSDHKARVSFAERALQAGGFPILGGDDEGFDDMAACAAAFAASGADGLVVCGTDAAYGAQLSALLAALNEAKPAFCILAGRPGEREGEWRGLGLTHAIFLGADIAAVLEDLCERRAS